MTDNSRSNLSSTAAALVFAVAAATSAQAASGDAAQPHSASPKRIVICMDGTWNSPAKKTAGDDGRQRFEPTNVLKTCRAVKDLDDTTATLVFTDQPQDGETVTIDGKTYTFQASLTDIDGNVQIGGKTTESLNNLRYAILKKRQGKPRYAKSTALHTTVGGREVPGDNYSMEIHARSSATSGDPFSTEETLTHGYWADKRALADESRRRGFDPAKGFAQITYYDLGVGALRKFPGFTNGVHRTVDKLFGGATGAGIEGNIEDAYTFLALNYRQGDEIFVFGFSRGASSARGLVRFIDWMEGVPPAKDAYWIPIYFDAFLKGDSSYTDKRAAIVEDKVKRLMNEGEPLQDAQAEAEENAGEITPLRVKFLGVWDTVLSLGKKRGKAFIGNAPPAHVDHIRQALAVDERRSAFRPRIWQSSNSTYDNQTLEQRWFAGVHSNVGGGYPTQGLSNLALEWMMGEACNAGLGFNWKYAGQHSGYSHAKLYNSNKPFWRFLQTITFQSRKGVREVEASERKRLTFHHSVLQRLASDKVEYRPKNLLRYLATIPDLDAFLGTVPGLPDDFELPKDVLQAIEEAR